MIKITEAATNKVIGLLVAENDPELKLRIFVEGGGCSGFQYGFTFDNTQNEDDFEVALGDGDYKLLVDAMSMQYLQEAEVDYTESLAGSQFAIRNPNAKTSCGCGSSFAV
jgi:iron-sulfur cluster insertion protein